MTHVAVIGSGVVGAAIAYELSRVQGLKITLLDRKTPASGSTGAALGVLMGAISQKTKGRAWKLRQTSIQRYESLIPELEAITGQAIPFNRQGILMLRFAGEEREKWEKLLQLRRDQGLQLEIWDRSQLHAKCPQLQNEAIIGAIYSPQDRQVDPSALTQALVAAAQINGITCQFGVSVENVASTTPDASNLRHCYQLQTTAGQLDLDWLVVAAGLGSTPLTASLNQRVDIRPVLGQALHLRLDYPLGNADFQPVITGDDVHIVPLGKQEYWVGATVETRYIASLHNFASPDNIPIQPEPEHLDQVMQQARSFCPALAEATIVRSWYGLRPRPEGRPAPIIGQLDGYSNVLLATGHYRNGVLLAPATAEAIREVIA